jgi:protein-disulfide isomerase
MCGYDDATPLTNIDAFISDEDEYLGDSAAPVRMIEFFDPNCSVCKVLFGVIEALDLAGSSKARMYYRPFPLWPYSIQQIQTIYLARDQGMTHEMIKLQFERQKQGGLSESELLDIAESMGLDMDVFRRDYRAGKYLSQIQDENRMIIEAGIESAPRLSIEG